MIHLKFQLWQVTQLVGQINSGLAKADGDDPQSAKGSQRDLREFVLIDALAFEPSIN